MSPEKARQSGVGSRWGLAFVVLLALTALYQAGFAFQLLVTPDTLYESLDIPFEDIDDFAGINTLVGLAQLYLIGMCALAIHGTRSNNPVSVIVGMTVGAYFLVVGITIIGDVDPYVYIIDIVRGTLILATGISVRRHATAVTRTGSQTSDPQPPTGIL